MKLLVEQYVHNRLKQAEYKFDDVVNTWIGWIEDISGVYAQADTLEGVRTQLGEILEEHLLLSLHDGKSPKALGSEFKNFHAKTALAS
ncbi:MAG: hypothetical protein HZA94_02540 [Candidatus Vogelbacteria bacterium]|nr:hypothetical protein [Candidatus Vogelbacteria bacterium]